MCEGSDELLGYKKATAISALAGYQNHRRAAGGQGKRSDGRGCFPKFGPKICAVENRKYISPPYQEREDGGQSIWTCSLWARTQHFSEYVCLSPEIGHGDKSLNVTFISIWHWLVLNGKNDLQNDHQKAMAATSGCERLDLYRRGHVGEAIYYVPAFNQFSTDSFLAQTLRLRLICRTC